jgi:hypothetical protein
MREDVQVGAAAVEVVDVAEAARACGTNRAMETQKGVIFMVAGVGWGINVSKSGRSISI